MSRTHFAARFGRVSLLAGVFLATVAPGAAHTAAASGGQLAGKRLCVSNIVDFEVLNIFYDDMRAAAKDSGNELTIQVVTANGDIARQIADTEQFVASGNCDAIATVTSVSSETAVGWTNAAAQAAAAGIPLVNHSSDWITNAAQNISNPHYPAGYLVGVTAGHWYMDNGSTGEVGTLSALQSPGLLTRTQGFMDGFRSVAGSGPKFWDAGVTQQAQDAASATANLLQAHPNISVVFTWGADTSVGALQAAREAGRTDPKKFFLGSIDVTDEQIGQIATGTTVLQGAATFPLRFSAVAMERGIERAMLGEKVPPTGYVKPFVITKDNALEYLRASNHQLIPENQHYFDELMVYFDTPVKTGDPFPDESTGYVWDGARTGP